MTVLADLGESRLTVELLLRAKRALQSVDIPGAIFICPRCRTMVTLVHVECHGCGVKLK